MNRGISLTLVIAMGAAIPILIAGCPVGGTSRKMAERAEERVKAELANQHDVPPVPRDVKPRLVVDASLSMAGYIAPPGRVISEFSRALEASASAMPEHELFVFGTRRANGQVSLDDLLVPRMAGLGQEFATDDLFRGPNNQDDLLFQAAGRDARLRPLVLFTDGVYSSPAGQGIQPVARALAEVLRKGWSVGFIVLRSAYYGTRCELVYGQGCGGGRLFYSEASTQRGSAEFFPLLCPVVRNRPFYIIVLSPTSDVFDEIYASLSSKAVKVEARFLFAGDKPPINLKSVRPAQQEGLYDQAPRWLMLTGKAGPMPVVHVEYSVDPLFPVERVSWNIQAEQVVWNRSNFSSPWVPVKIPQYKQEGADVEDVLGDEVADSYERLLWRSFPRDIKDLQTSFAEQAKVGDLAINHKEAVMAVQSWQPTPREVETLYCEYLDQPSLRAPSTSLSILRLLLAANDLRRQQPERVTTSLGSLLLSSPGGSNLEFTALAKDLVRIAGDGSSRATTLEAATETNLPAGRPSSQSIPPPSASGKSSDISPSIKQVKVAVLQEKVGVTYKIRLAPWPLRFSRDLKRLSTSDDSDIAFADRTYRLDNLVEHLVNSQLERIGSTGDLTIYVTVSGR